ncbi:TetR family transcriptional regulator [Klebsiella sp. JB_Kp040]|uniref:TetR/AcrR family transcriptional regulator n=1 Tax=Klebsiella TaxID=570 RepID=UPI001FCCA26F|nr:TetR family transcriptional regulator [Klebsiella michiganensis]MCS5818654.1 TetR family transcriptional regulator [Klebsiella pneumoniae subsp. pneumoniae]
MKFKEEIMAEKIPGLREQQKAATRKQLILTGVELFLRQGFVNTTIEQIVEPLGMAKRTFFRYFDTKEELLFAWQMDKTTQLIDELTSRPKNESPMQVIRATLSSLLKNYDASPAQALAFMRLTRETPALVGRDYERRMVWEQALAAALIERNGSEALDPLKARIIVGTVMSAWTAALGEWYDGEGKEDLRSIVNRAFSMISKK